MKRMLILTALLIGCSKEPVSVAPSTNPEIPVSKLFEYDGCTVYRFKDNGNYYYYSKCAPSVPTNVVWKRSCGKGCTETHQVTTSYTKPESEQ